VHVTAPPLPDLPPLAAHAPAPPPPPSVADAGPQPCRTVWTGSTQAALACARSLLFDRGDGGAMAIVPRASLRRDASTLPAIVDHRVEGTEGPVRNQSTAPACTAFATAAAIDHAIARWSGKPSAVSVMQIWSRYHSPDERVSLSSNVGLALGPESAWPFDPRIATSWIPCALFDRPPRTGCGVLVDSGTAARAVASPVGEFTEVEFLNVSDLEALQVKLAAGQDVVVTLELPSTFATQGRAGARYVPHWAKSSGPDAGHALLLAGYVRFPHGTYYLAHNSWGTGWGDGGFAWLHEESIRQWMRQAVALDAEPVDRDATGRPARTRGERTCDAGLVLDSIRGKCSPPCPDGSPRHDAVCAVAGQCPAGYVNLTGVCVLAAPTDAGHDPSTGVAWRCGPGGCSYDLPRSADPTCTGARCVASCPAPDFRIARMGQSLVCVE
jgi:hypothetical protein